MHRVSRQRTGRAARGAMSAAIAMAFAGGCGGPPLNKPADLAGMVRIPAGEFTMGRDDGADDERPAHAVWLDEYFIDRHEVTNAQFKTFCDATGGVYPNNPDWDPDYFVSKPDYPVVNVTWDQAFAYCAWSHKQLPTEAQWEKAARGTDKRLYPWGSDWADGRANLAGGEYHRSKPVGSFPDGVSPYGVLDMAGNVWEWCADWYESNYYAHSPARNPAGPAAATKWRVVRGGGFTSPKTDAVTTNRSKNVPGLTIHHLGCRCAWSKPR